MKFYKTIRNEPLSLNRFIPPHEPCEEIVSEEILMKRYHINEITLGKTYETYACLGLYISNTIIEEVSAQSGQGSHQS